MENKKAAFETLGCRVNLYDTEAMKELAIRDGYKIVPFNERADLYVINTCTVTAMGDKKSRQMVSRARKNNPNGVIAMVGCYPQVASEEIKNTLDVDIILGSRNKREIVDAVKKFEATGERVIKVTDVMEEASFEELDINSFQDHTRAFLKIQDGCNRFCSYCLIPYARGTIGSKERTKVLEEIIKLRDHGFKEIILTGIHIASYGLDLNSDGSRIIMSEEAEEDGELKGELMKKLKGGILLRKQGTYYGLLELLEDIDKIEGIERVRIGSIEPSFFQDDRIKRIASLKKLCPHFHLSLQSGSDSVLKRMNRRYDTKAYEEAVIKMRDYIKGVSITTDLIVGFPGETKEEFEETVKFLERISLSKIHVFKYSRRKGTPASKMKDQVSSEVKDERSKIAMEISQRKGRDFLKGMVSGEYFVLLEEEKDGFIKGYTENYTECHIKIGDGHSFKPGDIVKVKVIGYEDDYLLGDLFKL